VRLPDTAHTSRPWRIHELTRDFRLEDVWALQTPGGPHDFPRLARLIASFNPSRSSSRAVRALFAVRWRVGALLGWDGGDAGHGSERHPRMIREIEREWSARAAAAPAEARAP
jgi:Protein of unknown function (DUF2867)